MSTFQPQGRALSDLTNLLAKSSASFVVGLSLLPPNQQMAVLNAGQNVISQQQEPACPKAASRVPEKRSGKWSKEEDARLCELVDKKGARNWRLIGTLHGTRDAKQCRDRWTQYLDPSLVKTAFSEKDCQIILQAVEQGQKWSYLANLLPGRSANDIKNYYNCHLKRKRKDAPEVSTDQQQHEQQQQQPTAKRRQLVDETKPNEPSRTLPQPSLAQTVLALAPPVTIESMLPLNNGADTILTTSSSAAKDAVNAPNMLHFVSSFEPDAAPSMFVGPVESTTTVLSSSSPTHFRPTDQSVMSLLSPLFEPIRPLHADQQQQHQQVTVMSTPVRTNLMTRFDAESEHQNSTVGENGHPHMEPGNLSFFFCDEELDRPGEPEIQVQPALHPDFSFL